MNVVLAYDRSTNDVAGELGAQCNDCANRGDCFLAGVQTTLRKGTSAPTIERRLYHSGEYVIEQGRPQTKAYFVSAGTLKSLLCDATGDTQVLGFHTRGDTLGLERDPDGKHACSAVALETVSVCEIDRHELLMCLRASPEGLHTFLSRQGQHCAAYAAHLFRLSQKTAEQRIASFIVERIERRYDEGLKVDIIELPMSRADIGSYLSLAVETVSRLLSRLQQEDLIDVERHALGIRDEAGLRTLAGQLS